jgi:hypothetical protein
MSMPSHSLHCLKVALSCMKDTASTRFNQVYQHQEPQHLLTRAVVHATQQQWAS